MFRSRNLKGLLFLSLENQILGKASHDFSNAKTTSKIFNWPQVQRSPDRGQSWKSALVKFRGPNRRKLSELCFAVFLGDSQQNAPKTPVCPIADSSDRFSERSCKNWGLPACQETWRQSPEILQERDALEEQEPETASFWGVSRQHMKPQQPQNYDFRVSRFNLPSPKLVRPWNYDFSTWPSSSDKHCAHSGRQTTTVVSQQPWNDGFCRLLQRPRSC